MQKGTLLAIKLLAIIASMTRCPKYMYHGNSNGTWWMILSPFLFQTRKNDSNRLANRGGALLKEEKIRKGINRELPKVNTLF